MDTGTYVEDTPDAPLSEERRALNQATFRAANELLKDRQVGEPLQFLCECERADCRQQLSISLAAYEHVRAEPARFVVISGHEGQDEHVEHELAGYRVVRKEGRAAEVVSDLYPRW